MSTGALFLLVGMIYEQTHTRELKVYGGLWKIMPVFGCDHADLALSSMGLPGLNGFVGEFTILLGAFGAVDRSLWNSRGTPAFSAIGVIMAAVYILYMFQKMFLGPAGSITKEHTLHDLNWREIAILVPLLIFIFWIGLYPKPFFALIAPAVENLVAAVQAAAMP